MSNYVAKVYVVQKVDPDGKAGEILAVKLTFSAAHKVAKKNAPATVHFYIADKTDEANLPAQWPSRDLCN